MKVYVRERKGTLGNAGDEKETLGNEIERLLPNVL